MLAMGLALLTRSPCPVSSSAVFIVSGTRKSAASSVATTAGRVVRRLDSTWYEKSDASSAATSVGRVVNRLDNTLYGKSVTLSAATSIGRVVHRLNCSYEKIVSSFAATSFGRVVRRLRCTWYMKKERTYDRERRGRTSRCTYLLSAQLSSSPWSPG